MSFWSDPVQSIENAVSNPVQALQNLAPTIGQIGSIASAVAQGGTNPLADLSAVNGTMGLLGMNSGSSPSSSGGTTSATPSTAPTGGLSGLTNTASTLKDPSPVNLTPGLTSRESATINPYGAQFEMPAAKAGGLIQHYYGGGDVDINPEMPNPGQRPMLMHGHPGANLAPPSAHSMLNVAPHFADGGHVPEFYSEGGMHNRFVKGEGDGTSDDVPAMLANGEFVIPADVVSSLGNGSNDSGAKVLDSFLETIRAHKTAHDPKKLPPDSKGALGYLADAHKKVKA